MDNIPLFPLNIVLYPDGPLPLRIFETRYVDMVRRCLREDRGFGVVLIREGGEVGPAETVDVGTLARIVDFHQLPDGFLGLSCIGERRFKIAGRQRQADGLNLGDVEWLARDRNVPVPPRFAHLAELLANVLPQLGEVYTGIEMRLDDAVWVSHRLAEILPIDLQDKQRCLEIDDAVARLELLAPLVRINKASDGDYSGSSGDSSDGGHRLN
jgi:uncharacterized protein